jgi:transcriptional regulator with XRE-family HTH domain
MVGVVMKKNKIIKKYFSLLSIGFLSYACAAETITQIEEELISTKQCSVLKAKEFLKSLSLTQDDIAEALRINESTLSEFIKHDKFSERVMGRLEWYYTNVNVPLSKITRPNTFDISVFNNMEDEFIKIEKNFMESRNHVLLPKQLKNKDIIKNYLSYLVNTNGNRERDRYIDLIAETLPIKKELLCQFLDGDNIKFHSNYIALRNYYRSDKAQKLSEVVEEYNKKNEQRWFFSHMFKDLMTIVPSGYQEIKQH